MIIEDLREYIFPIFSVPAPEDGSILLGSRKFLGTGFFVSKEGDAITASHVIPPPEALEHGHKIIAIIMHEEKPTICWINKALCFPEEDIALIEVNFKGEKYFSISSEEVSAGTDVTVIGYPAHSVNNAGLEARVLKGHVTLSHKNIELNFPIPAGMSGAPVIVENKVIAISTGRVRSEELVDSYEEEMTLENHKERIKIIETRNVTYYGIAAPLSILTTKREPLLKNLTLIEFISQQQNNS